jgi:hypothetical protein
MLPLQVAPRPADRTHVNTPMTISRGIDDPRKLRDVLARTEALAAEHDVASVVVGFAARESSLLFPEFLAFLGSELRVEDQIFRLTRERALLVLRDVDAAAAQSVVERLRAAFDREFPATDVLDVEIRYLAVPPGPADLSVKQVLPAIFAGAGDLD